jgi:hypothetical protein
VRVQADVATEDAHPAVLQQVTTSFADEMEGISVGHEAPQQNFTISDANTSLDLLIFCNVQCELIRTHGWSLILLA